MSYVSNDDRRRNGDAYPDPARVGLRAALKLDPGLAIGVIEAILAADPAITARAMSISTGINPNKVGTFRALITGVPQKRYALRRKPQPDLSPAPVVQLHRPQAAATDPAIEPIRDMVARLLAEGDYAGIDLAIDRFIAEGKIIHAVCAYRHAHRVDLFTAKAAIEARANSNGANGKNTDLGREVEQLLADGKLVNAIAAYQRAHGVNMAAAYGVITAKLNGGATH
jgi:hypothetical protein